MSTGKSPPQSRCIPSEIRGRVIWTEAIQMHQEQPKSTYWVPASECSVREQSLLFPFRILMWARRKRQRDRIEHVGGVPGNVRTGRRRQ
jgi:hypothetical protein